MKAFEKRLSAAEAQLSPTGRVRTVFMNYGESQEEAEAAAFATDPLGPGDKVILVRWVKPGDVQNAVV